MKKQSLDLIKRLLFGVLGLIVLLFFWNRSSFSENFETASLDYRYKNFNKGSQFHEDIVYLDIDEYSLKFLEPKFGRWPWPRSAHKGLIEFLMKGNPKAILFDIVFDGEQKTNNGDNVLAQISQNSKVVSHALMFDYDSGRNDIDTVPLPSDYEKRFLINWRNNKIPNIESFNFNYHDYIKPVEIIYNKTPHLHVVNANPDFDGVFRKIPTLFNYDKQWLPSLSLQAVFSTLKAPSLEYEKNSSFLGGEEQHINIYDEEKLKIHIPIKNNGELDLHYFSSSVSPQIYSYARVYVNANELIKGKIIEDKKNKIDPFIDLKDKIIIIGASATGLGDLKVTPIESKYPGALLHATAISNILQNEHLVDFSFNFEILMSLSLILIIYLIVFFGPNFLIKSALPLFVLFLYGFLCVWVFQLKDYHWPLTTPLFFGMLAYGDAIVFLTLVERKKRKKISSTLSKYLSPEMTRQIIDSGVNPTAEVGQKKELSILFCDIRGFTSMSEVMSAEVLVSLLNEYLAKMTSLIFSNKGTLDKFIGDAIMAFWGAPIENENHAELAVLTAIEMIEALHTINKIWIQKGIEPIKIGIGINTGPVIVGNIGSEMRLDYTVIGDNVNLASRIEGLTKQYEVQVLIGQGSYDKIKNKYLCRPVDFVVAKGKKEPILIYEPILKLDLASENDIAAVNSFESALKLYRQGLFSEALNSFEVLYADKLKADKLCAIYILRCSELLKNTPVDWDGIFVAKMK